MIPGRGRGCRHLKGDSGYAMAFTLGCGLGLALFWQTVLPGPTGAALRESSKAAPAAGDFTFGQPERREPPWTSAMRMETAADTSSLSIATLALDHGDVLPPAAPRPIVITAARETVAASNLVLTE